MNYRKRLFVLTISVVIGGLFYCTNEPTSPDNRQNLLTHKGLYGRLVDKKGNGVLEAKMIAVPAANGLSKITGSASASLSGTDSVSTDSSGYYSFESLSAGIYNLQGDYSNGKLVVLISNITYDSAGAIIEVKTDTLRAPGRISGMVNTHTDDNGGVVCYIPGTSYLAITGDTGSFLISNIPQGNYKITYRKDGLMVVNDTGIAVRSGETTKLSAKNMEADPAYPPPAPANVLAIYDTLHGCVVLKWKPVIVSDFAGYVLYRNDTASTNPQVISKSLVTDTTYIDTVFSNLSDTKTLAFSYRIKTQDKDANLSTVYSKPVNVITPSPTMVRTLISWNCLNTSADTASINDSIGICLRYSNATRKIVQIVWYLDNTDSIIRKTNDSSFAGDDTLTYSSKTPGSHIVYVKVTDAAGTTWNDNHRVTIIQDIPTISISSNSTFSINTPITFFAQVSQKFGSIIKYRWDNGIAPGYDDSTGSTITTKYLSEGSFTIKLEATDDDNNVVLATKTVTVTNDAPVIISLKDTTISIKDTITFSVTATDNNGLRDKYYWDFGDGSSKQYDTTTAPTASHAFPATAMKCSLSVAVADSFGKFGTKKAIINVVLDAPVANAGNDTTVSINASVSFHGTAVQQFGAMVMYKWDFDGNGTFDDSSATSGNASHIFTHEAIYNAKLLVRDDDGNEATAIRVITVANAAPVISSIRQDTTISIKDSIQFYGVAADIDGTIKEYAWDLNGDGTFEYSSGTQIKVGYRYTIAGTYSAVLRVTDDDNKKSYDTARVSVLQDVPVVKLGNDTTIAINQPIQFSADVSQQFGYIVKYYWDIEADGIWNDSTATPLFSTSFSTGGLHTVAVKVLDDDGNTALDTIDVNAVTFVSGIIGGSVSYTTTNSPYVVTDNLLVSSGVTLTVNPGVELRFKAGKYIQVEGSLNAPGTSLKPAIFTSDSKSPAKGDWGGIIIRPTGGTFFASTSSDVYQSGTILNHVIVSYATTGIYVYNTGLLISSSNIMQNTTGIEIRKTNHIVLSADTLTSNTTALYSIYENYTGDGYGDLTSTHIVACDFHKNESGINLNTNQRTIQDLVIDSCLFRNHTDAAISVGGGGYGPHIHSISITNNSVHDNGSGILFPQFYSSASGALTPYPVIVQKNTVINNSGDAFSKGYGEVGVLIEDNTVTNNGRVLSLTSGQSMPCLFRYNTVTGNSSGVKIGDNASYIPANWEFQKNNFEQNAGVLFDVAYGSGFTIQSNNIVNNNGTPIMRNTTAIDVDATGNYWGSVLESNIPGLIEDYYDNFTYGKVLFTPVVLTRITDAGRRQ